MEFQKSTVYQIYPKSFADANGDGVGDLKGITQKLDYIHQLGADYIWITPFFRSPQRDNGYDIADYRAIEPMYGTMADFEALVQKADALGIGVMLDMVFNHTSTEHEWFKKALAGDETYQNYYIFRDGSPDVPPTNWQSKFGGSAWAYVPHLKKWYLHLFDTTQADLNWENPVVREELKDVLRFWKAKGVKGFRFDVINLISKPDVLEDDLTGDGRRFYTDGPRIHKYLKELHRDAGLGDVLTVGEMSSTSLENCIRYTDPQEEELNMTFSFHHLKVDYRDGEKWKLQPVDYRKLKDLLETWQTGMAEHGGWNALFWCNHDQPRTVARFGDTRQHWRAAAKMLATLMYLMRGTPYIYQGEELGMKNAGFTAIDQYRDVESLNYYRILTQEQGLSSEEALHILAERSRDNGRTPMQWTAEPGAGFSTATPWIGLSVDSAGICAETQVNDPDSIFTYFQQLIALRKAEPVVGNGTIEFLFSQREDIFAYRRTGQGQELVVLCNLTGQSISGDFVPLVQDMQRQLGNYPDVKELAQNQLRPYESVVYLREVSPAQLE